MKKTLFTIIATLCLTTLTHAQPCGWQSGYRGYYGGGGYCGGGGYYRGWVSYTGVYNGGGCYAPILYGNPYAGGYYPAPAACVPVYPSGINISVLGLNILGINP